MLRTAIIRTHMSIDKPNSMKITAISKCVCVCGRMLVEGMEAKLC